MADNISLQDMTIEQLRSHYFAAYCRIDDEELALCRFEINRRGMTEENFIATFKPDPRQAHGTDDRQAKPM